MSEVLDVIDELDELAPLASQIAATLPHGWKLETLGSLCEKSQYGWTTKADRDGTGVKFLRTTDITPGVVDWEGVPFCVEAPADLDKYLIKDGDILISRTGSIGVNYLVTKPEPAVFASYLIRFRPKKTISTKYLKYYLQSPAYWRAINVGKKGIAVQNVNATMLSRIPVPVAPADVQKEIVAELEKQFSRLDEAVANLQRVKANLKRYKASVLKAAVEGRLVETEASIARREGCGYETGEQLLQRILERRRVKWVGRGKYKEPSPPNVSDFNQLPNGWIWVSGDQLTSVITDGEHITPRRTPDGVLLLSARNVLNGSLALDDVDYVPEEEYARIAKRIEIQAGDVLLSCSGTVGRSCVVPQGLRFTLVRSVAVLRPVIVLADFITYNLQSPLGQFQIDDRKTQTAQANLFQGKIRQLVFALPPLAEQARIVAEVDRHLSIVREVEAEVDTNLKRAQALRQATLAKAFSAGVING